MSEVPKSLVENVDLLCLDAGNCVIFLDHARLAMRVSAHGARVEAAALVRAEGAQKRLQEQGALVRVHWPNEDEPGARGWGMTVATMLAEAGVDHARLPKLLSALWPEHVDLNFWSLVPGGLGAALDALRALRVRVAIVSNSEGMLERLFERLGVLGHFDLVVDSGKVGIEKPDPRIFRLALDAFAIPKERALHLGDSVATDIVGARSAGLRVGLIDPFGHVEGRHLDVPRVPGVVAVARAIAAARGGPQRVPVLVN